MGNDLFADALVPKPQPIQRENVRDLEGCRK